MTYRHMNGEKAHHILHQTDVFHCFTLQLISPCVNSTLQPLDNSSQGLQGHSRKQIPTTLLQFETLPSILSPCETEKMFMASHFVPTVIFPSSNLYFMLSNPMSFLLAQVITQQLPTLNRAARPVQGKRQKYATEGNIQGTEDMKVNPWGLFLYGLDTCSQLITELIKCINTKCIRFSTAVILTMLSSDKLDLLLAREGTLLSSTSPSSLSIDPH